MCGLRAGDGPGRHSDDLLHEKKVLKHTAPVLMTQNYCKHGDQDPMTASAAERWEERSTDAGGQRAAALTQSVHKVICDKEQPGHREGVQTDLLERIMSGVLACLHQMS